MRVIVSILTLLMALCLASIVAYVSVTGLMKLFAGAGMIGMVFFILIESSKIISTTLLHTFKSKIKGLLRIGLNLGIGIAMIITSVGIYGFLSSTYKETFLKSENTMAQIELIEKKRDGYQEQLNYIITEKTSVSETINELSKGLSNNVIQYKDKETGEILTTTSSSTRRALEKQLDKAIERQTILNSKSDSLGVMVFDMENQILESKLGDETAAELGPLIFLSEATGMTMDDVMKWFILLLIVIGDPLAVIMVIAFNKIIKKKVVEGLPMGALIGDEPQPTMTDDEIIEKGRQLKLDKVFAEAAEMGRKRRESMSDEEYEKELTEPEPTALAFTNFYEEIEDEPNEEIEESIEKYNEEFDEEHALDMAMNNMVEELMEGHETVEDFIESLELTPEDDVVEVDKKMEDDKSKVVDLPRETQIEVIETPVVKEEIIEVIPPKNRVIDNSPPNKRMGIDRIR